MMVGLDIKNKVMWCGICSNEVRSKYYRIDEYDKIVCNRCYEKVTRCQVCYLPSFSIQIIDSLRVCSVCYSRKDTCLSCEKPLADKLNNYIQGLQGFFCSSCYNLSKKCSRCSLPILNNSRSKLVDKGLLLCPKCASYSVLTEEIASTVFSNIQMLLSKQTGIEFSQKTLPATIKLIYKSQMQAFLSRTNRRQSFDPLETLVYSSFKNNNHFIYSLVGLPLRTFISYVSYEYSKIIAFKHCGTTISSAIKEGFASWLAMKLLFLLGYNNEINKTPGLSDISSFGFRKIKLIERNAGVRGVIDFINQTEDNKVLIS